MKDEHTGWIEADITVNGRALTFAESMSLRVAVSTFRVWLSDPGNRAGLGPRLAANYDHHLALIERTMLERP